MMRGRKTRIVATLGPASYGLDKVRALAEAGVDVFRLNFSHGSHDNHAAALGWVRQVEALIDRPLAVLADLQGPKLRIGRFADGAIALQMGQTFRLDLDPAPGDATRVSLPHPEILCALAPGDPVLLDDGRVQLAVVSASDVHADTVVVAGEVLSDRKGVNIPGSVIPIPAMTDKDRVDLAVALAQGVDWVALSFVQRGSDMAQLQALVQGRAGLIAKIEKPAALQALDGILDHCDAIMVARGDLGVELSPQDVPVVQKKLVRAARARGLPVIVATQMLESMIGSPAPTRAEASDVANAVYEGVDAVMLSAETAAGKYPVEAVRMMDRVIASVENDERWADLILAESPVEAADTLIAATVMASQSAPGSCIAAFTSTGRTALRLVRERPQAHVVALSPDRQTARRLALAWGVETRLIGDVLPSDDLAQVAYEHLVGEGGVAPGDRIFVLAGLPMGTPGNANILRMVQAPQTLEVCIPA